MYALWTGRTLTGVQHSFLVKAMCISVHVFVPKHWNKTLPHKNGHNLLKNSLVSHIAHRQILTSAHALQVKALVYSRTWLMWTPERRR